MIMWLSDQNEERSRRIEESVLKLIKMGNMGEIIDEDFGAFVNDKGNICVPCVIDTWDEDELRSHRYDWEKDLIGIYRGAPWFEDHEDAYVIPVAFCLQIINGDKALVRVIHNYKWA